MKKNAFENKINALEELIRKKTEFSCNYGDLDNKIRTLSRVFRYFDVDNLGVINYKDFFAAMTKNNFVAVQKEIENLFNRYDEDNAGHIDYLDFCCCIFGVGSKRTLTNGQREVFYKINDQMVRRAGIAGTFGLSKYLRTLQYTNDEGAHLIDGRTLSDAARKFISISQRDLELVANLSEPVNLDQFLSELKRGMSLDRKLLVSSVFRRLDKDNRGYVTVRDMEHHYRHTASVAKQNHSVPSGETVQNMVNNFMEPGESDKSRTYVYWLTFLDYYRCISLSVESETDFEILVRNSWYFESKIAAGEPFGAYDPVGRTTLGRVTIGSPVDKTKSAMKKGGGQSSSQASAASSEPYQRQPFANTPEDGQRGGRINDQGDYCFSPSSGHRPSRGKKDGGSMDGSSFDGLNSLGHFSVVEDSQLDRNNSSEVILSVATPGNNLAAFSPKANSTGHSPNLRPVLKDFTSRPSTAQTTRFYMTTAHSDFPGHSRPATAAAGTRRNAHDNTLSSTRTRAAYIDGRNGYVRDPLLYGLPAEQGGPEYLSPRLTLKPEIEKQLNRSVSATDFIQKVPADIAYHFDSTDNRDNNNNMGDNYRNTTHTLQPDEQGESPLIIGCTLFYNDGTVGLSPNKQLLKPLPNANLSLPHSGSRPLSTLPTLGPNANRNRTVKLPANSSTYLRDTRTTVARDFPSYKERTQPADGDVYARETTGLKASRNLSHSDQSAFGKTKVSPNKDGPLRRRVLVTHSDGSEEVVELVDELGNLHYDSKTLFSRLTEKGIVDISDVRL